MQLMVWKEVPGFKGYSVSNVGLVKGRRGSLLSQRLNRDGYPVVNIPSHPWQKVPTHVLVCLAFIGPPKEGQEVLHIDSDKTNNNVDNLRYGSKKDNAADRVSNGNNGNYRNKASPTKKVQRSDGRIFNSASGAARAIGCSPTLISRVLRGERKTTGGYTYCWV